MKLLLIAFSLLLVSCTSNTHNVDISKQEPPSHSLKEAATNPGKVKINEPVVDSDVITGLLNTIKNDEMRQEGLIKLTKLQAAFKNEKAVPVDSISILFEELIKNYPLYKNDHLLYQLSIVFKKSGAEDLSLNALNLLVIQYPDITYIDEVEFRRGNLLFLKQYYKQSENAYRKVVAYVNNGKKSVYYEQAVYKEGLSQFRQTHYQPALNLFMHLLDLHAINGRLNLSSMLEKDRKFIKKILHAINLSFSYQAGPATAVEYFSRRQESGYEYQLFLSLSDFYLNLKNYADSVDSLRLFAYTNAMHPQAPGFLLKVVDIYKQGGFAELSLDAKKDYVLRYNIKSPFWGLYGTSGYRTEYDALNINQKQLAHYYHSQAQKTGEHFNYAEAQRWYRHWLAAFPQEADASQISFQLAEALIVDKKYELAAIQYEKTAYDYGRHSKSAVAGYAALYAYMNRKNELAGFSKHLWSRQLDYAILRFKKQFPDYAKSGFKLIPSVERLLKKNTQNYNRPPESDIFNRVFSLIYSGEQLNAINMLIDFRKNTQQVAMQAEATKILALVYIARGDMQNASREYERVSYFPAEPPRQSDALWLSAELSEQIGNRQSAKKLYENFIQRFPEPLQQTLEACQRLIDLYEIEGKIKQAANWRIVLVNADTRGEQQRSERTSYLAARARFALAKPVFVNYRKIKLNYPLEKSLNEKYSYLDLAVNAYQQIASYKIEEVQAASNYQIAEIYRDFSISIEHSEMPQNLSEEGWAKYETFLKLTAYPFRQKAIEFYEMNVSRIKDNLHDAWMRESLERLKEFEPERYNKKEDSEVVDKQKVSADKK